MPRLMPALAGAALALVSLATLPVAVAAPPAVQLTGILDVPIPISRLVATGSADPGPAGAVQAAAGPFCDPASYRPDIATHSFAFSESEEQAGCMDVQFNLTLPVGAREIELEFEANRSVQQRGIPNGGPPNMVQSVRLLVLGSGTDQEASVFTPDELSKPRHDQHARFQVPERAGKVQLEWHFEDAGRIATRDGPGKLESFAATVWDPRIHFGAIPLADPIVEPAEGEPHGQDEYTARYTVATTVPPEFQDEAEAGQFALKLNVNATFVLDGIDGPDGQPLDTILYSSKSEGGVQTVTFPTATLRSLGPGPYTAHVHAVEVLQKHSAYQVLAYVMLAGPAIAIAAAWFGLRRTELDTGTEEP
ncbi:MAG: hypothetical protein ABR562_00665 [Thermoplasmatota archaeon]